jgi:hypothetical protein
MGKILRHLGAALAGFAILFLLVGWNLPIKSCTAAEQSKSYYAPDYRPPTQCSATVGSIVGARVSALLGDKNSQDDLLVLFTALLAIFTYLLFRATQGLLRHAPQIERAYISGGGSPLDNIVSYEHVNIPAGLGVSGVKSVPVQGRPSVFQLQINNHGKTPGELFQIGIGWCEALTVPTAPNYTLLPFFDWIGPGAQSRPLSNIPIPTNLSYPAIYGRFWYRDIFGEEHSSGFINAVGIQSSIPVSAPAVYTKSD